MDLSCATCGTPFGAKRSTAKYCSERCKKRAQRGARPVTSLPQAPPTTAPVESPVEAAVLEQLRAVEREGTALGQTTLALARRVDRGGDTGAGLAALAKQLEATLKAATADVRSELSPLDRMRDELAERRSRGA